MRFTVGFCVVLSVLWQPGRAQTACDDLQTTSTIVGNPFTIASACYVILPNDSMSMRVWGVAGRGTHTGLYMHVRDGSEQITGTWVAPSAYQTSNCDGSNNAVTHTDSSVAKDDDKFVFTWTAPASCEENEEFEIRAIVQRSSSEFQTISVPLVCNADYSNVEVLEKVRPPLRSQYCSQVSWAIIPKEASISFESPELDMNGWRHMFGNTDYQFTRNMGPTATANTGPNDASDGDYYLYYESTGSRKNDLIGLISPAGLQGCFCLQFSCHMNTDGQTRFTLSSIGEVKRTILDTNKVNTAWETLTFSFLSDNPVALAFQVISSGGERGDVGLDNIRVTAGTCDSDAVGYSGFHIL